VPLPQERAIRDDSGFPWTVTVDRGRLVLTGRTEVIVFDDPTDLRWFGMQLHRAAVEYDLGVQHAAAKASADQRQRRILAGEQPGQRHRPFVEPPEPAMNLDPLIAPPRLESA
jgi:hypothetical protein